MKRKYNYDQVKRESPSIPDSHYNQEENFYGQSVGDMYIREDLESSMNSWQEKIMRQGKQSKQQQLYDSLRQEAIDNLKVQNKQDGGSLWGTQQSQEKSSVQGAKIDLASILNKYKHLDNDSQIYAKQYNVNNERGSVEPKLSQSPRIDPDYEKIRRKYLDSNSPESKHEESVRKSAQHLYEEAKDLKQSFELLPNTSLDDLLYSLKNKFNQNEDQQKNISILEHNSPQKEQLKQSKEGQKFVDSLKQSPKVLLKAKQESPKPREKSNRKSQEQLELPKSSENKNLLYDKFVNRDFNDIHQKPDRLQPPSVAQSQNLEATFNSQQEISFVMSEVEQSKDFTGVKEKIGEIKSKQKESEQIEKEESSINNISEIPKPQSRNDSFQRNNIRTLKMPTKLTPQKQIKLQLPKFEQFSYKAEEEDKDDYLRDFQDIQDTLKTIKQMNLISSPQKDLDQLVHQEIEEQKLKNVKEEYKSNENLQDQNDHIDYNLSDSENEDDFQRDPPHHYDRVNQQNTDPRKFEINESQITFRSSTTEQEQEIQRNPYQSEKKINQTQNNMSFMQQKKMEIPFRDQELNYLINMIPITQEKFQYMKEGESKVEMSSQLTKVNYLLERLKYLNGLTI